MLLIFYSGTVENKKVFRKSHSDFHPEKIFPIHDDELIFEQLLLHSFQAGLSAAMVYKKRSNFRKAFDNYNFNKIAKYGPREIKRLMNDAGIIRNQKKIEATINNSINFIKIIKEFGTFDTYIWSFVKNQRQELIVTPGEFPRKDELSTIIAKDLKKRGFRFVGPTSVFAFLVAIGVYKIIIKQKEIRNELKVNININGNLASTA